jgi:hypothetical protein
VTLAKSYEPYGSVLTSAGTASSIFAYVGKQIALKSLQQKTEEQHLQRDVFFRLLG